MPETKPGIHAEHLKSISDGDAMLERLLVQALSRAIAKDPRTTELLDDGSRRIELDRSAASEISHVRDWLASDLAEKAHWLFRLDRNGVPVKLAKLTSLKQASNEADKAMRRRLSRGFGKEAAAAAAGEGTEIVAVLDDGWSVVRLATPMSLDAESTVMQHCIGHGGYDVRLETGASTFLSLRDPGGSPHVTIHVETRGNMIVEISGKQNAFPEDRYVKILRPFLRLRYAIGDDMLAALGFIRDADGIYHDIEDLPEILVLEGSADLSHCTGPIPKKIVAGDSLILPVQIPGGILDCRISVGRNLAARGGNLRRFLHPPVVGNALALENLPDFDEMHPDTVLAAKLVLKKLPSLRSLPDALAFSGDLVVKETCLEEIPSGMRDLSSLDIRGCPIGTLPDDLVVRADVRIMRCPVAVVPGSARFDGDVTISGTMPMRIETNRFGSSLSIECPPRSSRNRQLLAIDAGTIIAGDLKIFDARMPEGLPEGLRIGGNLVFGGGDPGPSGPGIQIGGNAYFKAGSVHSLPADLHVGKGLIVQGGKLKELGKGTIVGSDLAIDGDCLTSLPEGLVVGGKILLSMSNVTRIGEGFHVGVLDPWIFSDIAEFPVGMRVGSIVRTEDFRGRLPYGLHVEGNLDLSRFSPDEVPEGLVVEGSLVLPDDRRPSGP